MIGYVIFFIAVLFIIIIISLIVALKKDGGDDFHQPSLRSSWRQLSKAELAGYDGEMIVNMIMRRILREGEFYLPNVLIPLRNGHTTEIDGILISRKGLFCIETKNWIGHIYGSDEDEYWYQEYDDPSVHQKEHKNPVRQNENHCLVLDNFINHRYTSDNVVLFVKLENGEEFESKCAFSIQSFIDTYRTYENELTEIDIKWLYQKTISIYRNSQTIKEASRGVKPFI